MYHVDVHEDVHWSHSDKGSIQNNVTIYMIKHMQDYAHQKNNALQFIHMFSTSIM